MSKNTTPQSGTYNPPRLLPHPGHLEDLNLVSGLFCYVLQHPGPPGLSVLYQRMLDTDSIRILLGDWSGGSIEPTSTGHPLDGDAAGFLQKHLVDLTTLLGAAGIGQAQLYFSEGLVLADVRLSINKFIGPGMLNDMFGKLLAVPVVKKIEVLDDRALDAIRAGTGSYSGPLLVKTSRYRWVESGSTCSPLSVVVRR